MLNIFKSKFRIAILLVICVLLIGVFGYRYIANYSWVDALYMTTITITTVGFGEVGPLDDVAKLFTVGLILASVVTLANAVAVITEYFMNKNSFEQFKNRKMKKKIDKLSNHIIICGYGRNGKQAAQKLSSYNRPFVVIEKDKELIEKHNDEVLFVHGNANEDEILLESGIEKAHSIIVALPNDADNLFVVLSARQINNEIGIISRASQESSYKKLKLAGANNVIMPDKIGGDHMASLVVMPDLVEFLDNLSIIDENKVNVEEVAIEAITSTGGMQTIKDLDFRNKTGCSIIGYKTPEREYIINPEADTILRANSKLIVLGRPEQILALNKMFDL
ncbi:MAG: potassium channel protein [Kordia sp.]|nr:MAG: potassium channel protein [Kordia sp.]